MLNFSPKIKFRMLIYVMFIKKLSSFKGGFCGNEILVMRWIMNESIFTFSFYFENNERFGFTDRHST